jgi:hypothetical protein
MNSTWLHVTAGEKAKVERTLVLNSNQARGFASRLRSHKGVWTIFHFWNINIKGSCKANKRWRRGLLVRYP